ncbi:LTA synthase family protein [Ciceribacter azotifigens]|uniref:LTA synthase family protein n=1 Tax=Ciceribacter azotifigens TaxID=2069303 RepID=UPI003A8A7610
MVEIVSDPAISITPDRAVASVAAKANRRDGYAWAAVRLGNLLLLAILTVLTTEWIARGDLHEALRFLIATDRPGPAAVGILFLLFAATDALLGRAYQSALVLVPLAVIPAFISAQKQLFLSDPLYPSDMLFGRQILQLLPVMVAARPYLAVAIACFLVAALVALVYLWFFAWRRFPSLSRPAKLFRLLVGVPLIGGFLSLMDYAEYSPLRDRLNIIPMMWDQRENYLHNGFLLAFAFNLPMANVTAPEGYGAQAIDNIPQGAPLPAADTGEHPDVIMLMSESLWDPTRLSNVRLSPDPMPTIRKNSSGNVFSPEFGGMTANVEFEALTGFSNAFLPYGSIPYQQYVRGPVPSLATFFRSKGYVAKSFHPFQSWFWNRANVYEAFGFESFLSEENMPVMDKRGIFASDEAFTKELMRAADRSEKPFFFFGVTLQGHGPYEPHRYAKNTVAIDGPTLSPASTQSLATYAQGVREADQSLKMLMDWAKKRRRETIVVIFGDHLPPLGTVYPESGYMPDQVATRSAPLDIMKREHETPLVVWSSKKGVQKDLGSVSPAFLSYHVVKLAGYEHPFYTGVLGTVHARYEAIDRHQLVERAGGSVPDWSKAGKKLDPVVRDYRYLQHDMMFGEGFSAQRFFPEQVERLSAPAS